MCWPGPAGWKLRGPVGGDVHAYVDVTSETANASPMNMYMGNSPITLPSRAYPACTWMDGASIGGNLEYTGDVEVAIPASVVAGEITRVPVAHDRETGAGSSRAAPPAGERVLDWGFGLLRTIVILILFGLLLGWLFPKFMRVLPDNLKAQPLVSLGWGSMLYAIVFFGLLVIILVTIVLALVGLGGNIVWLGWLVLSVLLLGFMLATGYLAKVVVGEAAGQVDPWALPPGAGRTQGLADGGRCDGAGAGDRAAGLPAGVPGLLRLAGELCGDPVRPGRSVDVAAAGLGGTQGDCVTRNQYIDNDCGKP